MICVRRKAEVAKQRQGIQATPFAPEAALA